MPAAVAVAIAAGGAALASIPGPGGVLHGCYAKKGGGLRLIDPAKGQKCAPTEAAVSWNQAGISWQGTWASTTSYRAGDAVANDGSSYLAIKGSTGQAPGSSPADWALLAARGATGPRGRQGQPATPDLARVAILDWWGGPYSGAGYGFNLPVGIAFDGTHIWVVNQDGNSLTEINAANGAPMRTLSGASYGFSEPTGIAFDGKHLWVTNTTGDTVTEINAANGALVRTLSGGYGFSAPWAIAFDGTHLWVTDSNAGAVTEINAADGSFVQTLSDGSYGFAFPFAIAFDGTHMWVTNKSGDSVTEFNAADGSLVQVVTNAGGDGFSSPEGIAFDGIHLWVANEVGESVTELNTDGSLAQVLTSSSYQFGLPNAVAFDGTHIWVTNRTGSITEINASDGSFVRNLPGVVDSPEGIAFDGSHIWVTDADTNTVSEIPA